jgi:drug/metabolite transporter (DMT)-like permease
VNRPVLFLILSALLWSLGGLLIKAVEWHALGIAGARSAIAAVTIYLLMPRPRLQLTKPQLLSAAAYAATVILFVCANRLTTAANAIFLQYTSPIYIALFGAVFLGERANVLDWALILVTQVGILLFFVDRLTLDGWWGNVCALASGISYAMLTLLLRKQSGTAPFESVLTGNLLTFLICLPFMLGPLPDTRSWLGLVVLGVVQLGIPYFLYARAIQNVRALDAVLICTVEPVLNPLWVLLFLGERPQAWAVVGATLVLMAATARGVLTAKRLSQSTRTAPLETTPMGAP